MSRKRAVLVGCNYPGTKAELHGCVNDVWRMHKALIERFGFEEDEITVLIDTDQSYPQPTGANIKKALNQLISEAQPGDALFFHYSGHGTRVPAETGEQDDTGYDECIVPCDMNLMNDDDFREFVDRIPQGARLIIVSDSCHSGGLIDQAEEQIGDSFLAPADDKGDEDDGASKRSMGFGNTGGSNEGSGGWGGLLKEGLQQAWETGGVREALERRGFGVGGLGSGGNRRQELYEDEQYGGYGEQQDSRTTVKNRALSMDTLLEILRERTGRQDVEVGNIRPTLYDMFGEDSSTKVKKFVKVMMGRFQGGGEGGGADGGGGGFMNMVGSLATQFLQQKLQETDDSDGYAKPALEAPAPMDDPSVAYAGARKAGGDMRGILVSGCQSSQTSADANPTGDRTQAYGALSNAIQTIIAQHGPDQPPLSLRRLVMEARRLLASQGYAQQPGLYCTDENVDSVFIG